MKIFWKSYTILFFFITLGNFIYLISLDSAEHLYYEMMQAFHPLYISFYWANVLSLLLTIASALIILLWSFGLSTQNKLCSLLLCLRFAFDIVGHHYDFKVLQSAFEQNFHFGLIGLAATTFPVIPSYVGHWIAIHKKAPDTFDVSGASKQNR